MVIDTENLANDLPSKPTDVETRVLKRETVAYEDLSSDLFQESRNFSKQFAHVYAARLAELREVLEEKVKARWGNIQILKLTDLEDIECQRCVLIGTLYKHQQWKPSILRELSEDHQLALPAPRSDYCSEKDQPFLEDEMLRIKLVGYNVDVKNIITGVVCAVLGHEKEDGTFEVEDWCFPGCVSRVKALPAPEKSSKILLLSGLDLHNTGQSIMIALLVEWITGMAGSFTSQMEESSIVRVIIAGNSVRGSAEVHTNKGHAGGKAQDNATSKETAMATRRLDHFLRELVSNCCVTLMPGEHDPTSVMMPQRPLHPCMLPESSRYKSFNGATNPWIGKIGTRTIIGSSGQPIQDMMRVSGVSDVSPLEWLERTLIWRHLCPTAPDTLPSYPYYKKDAFIMKECPDVYFVGNMDKYETKMWNGEEKQRIRLVCIPRFSTTHTAVLVDLKTLDCEAISFGIDEI